MHNRDDQHPRVLCFSCMEFGRLGCVYEIDDCVGLSPEERLLLGKGTTERGPI